MKESTIKEMLKSADTHQNARALKFISKRAEDINVINTYRDELNELRLKSHNFSKQANRLLLELPIPGWYKSYYKIRIEFYESLELVINNIVIDILRNSKNARVKLFRSRVKRFIQYLGEREMQAGIHMADYVNLAVREDIRSSNSLGSHSNIILEHLEKEEIIEIRKDYSSDKKYGYSRGYRIHRKWIETNCTSVDKVIEGFPESTVTSTHEILCRLTVNYNDAINDIEIYVNHKLLSDRITVINEKALLDKGRLPKVYILDENMPKRLVPHYNLTLEELNRVHKHTLFFYKKKLIGSALSEYRYWKRMEVAKHYVKSLVKLLEPDRDKYVTTDGRRLYTEITFLPKVILPHVRLNGDKLSEIDLRNAQWRLLLYCLDNPQLNNLASIYVREIGCDFESEADFQEVRKAIEKGEFYEYILSQVLEDIIVNHFSFNQPINLNKAGLAQFRRNAAKMLTFLVLFSSNDYNPPVKEEFARVFPTLSRICEELKTPEVYNYIFPIWKEENLEYFENIYEGKIPEPGEVYKELPKELQRVEGNLIIDTILPILLENGIQALTKHDAYLIPSDQINKAKLIIYNQFDKLFGIKSYKLK